MFTHFHKLLQLFGGRCIIVEEGEARYVVLPIKEYLALSGKSTRGDALKSVNSETKPDSRTLERIDQEIEWTSRSDEDISTKGKELGRRRSEEMDDAALWRGEPRPTRAGEEDAGARRSDRTDEVAAGEPGAERAGEGGADDRREESPAESRTLERPRSEYRIEDIPF